ncbi:MAG: hypothetical protein WEA82_08105 [Idiomarina sp.]
MQLRYHGMIKLVPVCAWVTLAAILFAAVLAPPDNFTSWFIFSLLVMVLATLVAWLSLEVFRTRIGINASHLVVRKSYHRVQRIDWQQVERIDYNNLWASFVVVTKSGQRVFISSLMSNLKHFLTVMAEVLPREKYIDALDRFAKALGK